MHTYSITLLHHSTRSSALFPHPPSRFRHILHRPTTRGRRLHTRLTNAHACTWAPPRGGDNMATTRPARVGQSEGHAVSRAESWPHATTMQRSPHRQQPRPQSVSSRATMLRPGLDAVLARRVSAPATAQHLRSIPPVSRSPGVLAPCWTVSRTTATGARADQHVRHDMAGHPGDTLSLRRTLQLRALL